MFADGRELNGEWGINGHSLFARFRGLSRCCRVIHFVEQIASWNADDLRDDRCSSRTGSNSLYYKPRSKLNTASSFSKQCMSAVKPELGDMDEQEVGQRKTCNGGQQRQGKWSKPEQVPHWRERQHSANSDDR
jgi:hypothetical protein